MVVDAGLSISCNNFLVVLGRLACRIQANIELVFAVCITVIVVELVIELHLDIVVHPPVKSKCISLGSSTVDIAEIEVASLIAGAELDISKLTDGLDLGVLATVCIIALLSTEKKITGLDVPSSEVLGLGIGCIGLETDIVTNVGSLVTEAVPVTCKLYCP